jgi:hypothetical protein
MSLSLTNQHGSHTKLPALLIASGWHTWIFLANKHRECPDVQWCTEKLWWSIAALHQHVCWEKEQLMLSLLCKTAWFLGMGKSEARYHHHHII